MHTYHISECAVFCRVNERWGEFSNMSAHPMHVGCVRVKTSEALYQALKYPHLPDVQQVIIEQTSPMASKMVQKPMRASVRPDWENIKVRVMDICLRIKTYQHYVAMSFVFEDTDDMDIVELSRRDNFWGVVPTETKNVVQGKNVLGTLWMKIRADARSMSMNEFYGTINLDIPDLIIQNQPIFIKQYGNSKR